MAKIKPIADLPFRVSNACVIRLGNKIYIMGGEDDNGDIIDSIIFYDVISHEYTDTENVLTDSLKNAKATIKDGDIYIFGGTHDGFTQNYKIYKYNDSSGCVDTGKTFTYNYIQSVTYNDVADEFILTNNTTDYGVVSGDLNTTTTITDSKLKTFNLYNFDRWICIGGNTIYTYTDYEISPYALVGTKTIPTTVTRVECIHPISINEYLIITSDSYQDVTFYRYNAYTNTLTKQYNLNTEYDNYIGFSVGGYDFNVYIFGGVYENDAPTVKATVIEFQYYLITYNYTLTDVDVTPVNSILDLYHYDCYYMNNLRIDITNRNVGFDLVNSSVSGTYGNDDITPYITYDGSDTIIDIVELTSDIDITVTSYHYRNIEMHISDGITPSVSGNEWVKGTNFLRLYTLQTGYVWKSVKILNGSTDITNTVWTDATKMLLLPSGSWASYTNVKVYLTATTNTVNMTLYKNISNDNVVDKSIQVIGTLEGNMRDEISVLYPTFTVDTTSIDITLANYVYVENFKRYYYITSMECVRTNLWRIHLRVDVLMSYKDKIKNINCVVGRSASEYFANIPDAEDVLQADPIIDIEEIPNDVFDVETTTGTDHVLVITSM